MKLVYAVLLMALFLAAGHRLRSEEIKKEPVDPKIDLGGFIKEVSVFNFEGKQSGFVIWVPLDLFIASGLNNTKATKVQLENGLAPLKPYLIFLVQRSIDKKDGTPIYASENEVFENSAIKKADGSEIKPIKDFSPKALGLAAAMKDGIAKILGPGANFVYILFFPANDEKNQPLIETTTKNKLTMVLKENGPFAKSEFTWHTPFDATTPPKVCAKCAEKTSSKWSYCPWCGKKIE